MHITKSSLSLFVCVALAATSSGSIAATTADTEIFTGGAFDKRVKGPPTSRAVPPSEIDIDPLAGELLTDASSNTNQLVLRVDPRSAALRTDLLRIFPASQLDTQSGFERAVIDAVRGQKDRGVLIALGNPSSARYVIINGRDTTAVRLQAGDRDPRELLQQSIVLRYATTQAALAALASLNKSPYTLSVQMDYALTPSSVATDPLYLNPGSPVNAGVYQWGLHAMNFAGAWARSTGHAYVGIADAPIWPYNSANVFDFGTAASPTIANPDLRHNFRQQFAMLSSSISGGGNWNAVSTGFGTIDVSPHGQHVVGIVAAGGSNSLAAASGTGTVGACPNCSVVVSGRRGSTTTSFGHAESIYQLVDAGVSVINLSANSPTQPPALTPTCGASDVSALAISYAVNRDVLYVVSSGNENYSSGAQYPANCAGTLVVGAAENTSPSVPASWQRMLINSTFASSATNANGTFGVIAPGRHVLSTFNRSTYDYNSTANCGTAAPSDISALGDLYGTCSGTSMSAPHIAALGGILRSASPLTTQLSIQTTIRNSGGLGSPTAFFGWGMPNAGTALANLIPKTKPQNRLTPLFSMYSPGRADYFYTTSPHMARAAIAGSLLPMGNNSQQAYAMVGPVVSSYVNLPNTQWFQTTGAQSWVFSTPENPKAASVPLVPLFRLSFACNSAQYSNASSPTACANNPQHTDTTYTTDQAGINSLVGIGYRLDGIEGYIYPKSLAQPIGTVRLLRKYNAARDDHAIFPEPLLTQYQNEGYTLNSGSDWLGYVYQNSNGNVPTIQ